MASAAILVNFAAARRTAPPVDEGASSAYVVHVDDVQHVNAVHLRRSKVRRNITLRIDDALLREAKVLAASRDTSVSKMLAQLLEEHIRAHRAYESARGRALIRLQRGYGLALGAPPAREELHER